MEIILPIALFVAGFVLGAFVIWQMKEKEKASADRNADALEACFGNLSRQALQENQRQFLELAQNEFAKLQADSGQQMNQKKELINSSLQTIHRTLKDLHEGNAGLKAQMETSGERLDDLRDTTDKLRLILSSSQARGQWGERLVQDILEFLGLKEGINFEQQSMEGSDRPDFTFHLPREKRLNMDVKFPIAHYKNYIEAEDEAVRVEEKKQFLKDIRKHITAVSNRGYIDPAGGTVDYVLLFIPNESIYSFINQEDSDLLEFAMRKRIVLCSPLTLYAVLSLIRQSVASFAVERKSGDLQKLVQDFSKQWEVYGEKVDSLSKSLTATNNHMEQLKSTRTNALERPMRKILELNLEQEDAEKISGADSPDDE